MWSRYPNNLFRLIFLSLAFGHGVVLQAQRPSVQTPINLKPDIVYKTTAEGDLKMDLYYPVSELVGAYPLVVYTHGGGWAAGSKEKAQGGRRMGAVVRGLTEAGFCVAAVNYRLCNKGDTRIRDCVTDAMDTVRYLAKHGEKLHIDPTRVFTFGDSAGGQLAQMLLLAPTDAFPGAAELAGQRYTMVAGVSWYGPSDFEKTELFNPDGRPNFRDRFSARLLKPETGPSDQLRLYREVSPINYLRKDGPPLLMIQGDKDTTIPVHHAYYMQEKAKARNAPVEIFIVKNAGHNWREADGVTPIEPPLNDIVQRTVDFLVSKRTKQMHKYDGTWESLQKMPVPAWFDDGKIGLFIHWGPYSVIGYLKGGRGYSEHVPKAIYQDPNHYYPYMDKRWGAHPPEFGYKEIVPEFTAANWNPDEWAALFKEAGVKYVVLTAEHHDGWANWDSDLTPWNAVDKGPHRDLVGDLGAAVRKQGLKYAPSYHRERHTGFFAKEKYVVYSEPLPDIAEEIKRVPEAAMLYGPEFSYTKAYVDDYVARWKEIQEKYHPDMMWLDNFPIYTRDGNKVRGGKAKPEIQYFDDQVRGMITGFMNQGAARDQAVYVNNKGGQRNWPDGVGCLEKDNLKMRVIGPKWQSCTTFGTSFGYLEGDTYKSIEGVIHEMIEVISRNGNFLVNIGPKADGTIPEPQVERLRAMGEWLAINGDAIYGTRYWKVCTQESEHLAFTTKGKNLYAIKLTMPTAPFTIEGTAGWGAGKVKSVKLLGSVADILWEMTAVGLRITPPAELGTNKYAWTFAIVTDEEQHVPNVMVKDASEALKNTGRVDLDGRVGSGNRED